MGLKDLMKTAADGATDLVKKELGKKELERQQAQRIASHISIPITIKNGVGGISGSCVIRQRPEDGLVYFNMDETHLYEPVDYSWSGPIYGSQTNSQTISDTNSQTVKKGKSGKMAAGALVGTILFPGVGTVVGAAIGAGGKSKSTTTGFSTSSTNQIQQTVEQPGVAVIKFKSIDNGNILPITIICTTEIDAKIRCLQFKQTTADISKKTAESLNAIKALKELLDMGAITQEEFERKKKQILND